MDRSELRAVALQALYPLFYNKSYTKGALESIAEGLGTQELTLESLNEKEREFLVEIVEGIIENKDTLDERLNAHLNHWTMDRLDSVDALILRIATYEIQTDDTGELTPVYINEAVDLTKKFSNESSGKLVNGVLQSIADESETV